MILARRLNRNPSKSADAVQRLREAMAKLRAEDPEAYDYKMDEMRQDAARGDPDEPEHDDDDQA